MANVSYFHPKFGEMIQFDYIVKDNSCFLGRHHQKSFSVGLQSEVWEIFFGIFAVELQNLIIGFLRGGGDSPNLP